jgi:2-polyprenyl-3-methyl-5-hydroxy-6-metoxy-1,4-benzoquinol methylase
MKTKNAKKGRLGVPGSKPQDMDRRFDTTQLHERQHGRFVHRDYAAHFFRWGFASRFVKGGVTRVLDVGCGQELPLLKVLAARVNTAPALYVGVDLNKIPRKSNIRWVGGIHDCHNFVDDWKSVRTKHGTFDLITNFEMIEHMHSEDGYRLLRGMKKLLAEDGSILLSTPVYDGRKMAANHLKEYTVAELKDQIESAGLQVRERYGTFASWNDVRRVCTPVEKELLDEVGSFYGGDVLACFLAPKYPDASRNNVWVLQA